MIRLEVPGRTLMNLHYFQGIVNHDDDKAEYYHSFSPKDLGFTISINFLMSFFYFNLVS